MACATTAPLESGGWTRHDVSVAGRVVATAAPARQPAGAVLTVVIEGDGRAHDGSGRPTRDPTPSRPLGLAIAHAWPDGPRAWVARPCQFTQRRDPACRPADWTADRFSAPMLAMLDGAVDDLKRRADVSQVRLVGWSGGGVMAAALARRRADVTELVTIAAPLDVQAWTSARRLSPLNLAPEVESLATRPLPLAQRHLLGERDRIVPPAAARAWAARLGGAGSVRIVDETHAGDWPERLKDPEILKRD